jgi:hypothetical protein
VLVELWGIHSGEAVPSDALLDGLARVSGTRWGHFYLQG